PGAHPAVDDPQVAFLGFGEHHAPHVQRRHPLRLLPTRICSHGAHTNCYCVPSKRIYRARAPTEQAGTSLFHRADPAYFGPTKGGAHTMRRKTLRRAIALTASGVLAIMTVSVGTAAGDPAAAPTDVAAGSFQAEGTPSGDVDNRGAAAQPTAAQRS